MLRTINLAIDEIIYDCEHAQGTGDTARQLCFPRGHCPPYGAEIRDVRKRKINGRLARREKLCHTIRV